MKKRFVWKWGFIFVIILLLIFCGFGCQVEKKKGNHDLTENRSNQESRDSVNALLKIVKDPYWDEFATFLAGLPLDSTSSFYPLTQWKAWVEHQAFMEKAWGDYTQNYLIPFTQWARESIDDCRDRKLPVFYPFSGPDWAAIHGLYPGHSVYVLFGLEPEGHIQRFRRLTEEWTPATASRNLRNLQQSLDEILRLNFFKTKDMAVELRRVWLDGATPLLLVFLKRTGYEVYRVERIQIDSLLNEILISDSVPYRYNDGILTGVRILFRDPGVKRVDTLYFFCQDVRDSALERFPTFLEWLRKKLTFCCSFTKAASYLMHYREGYTKMRDFILSHSTLHVQDDTGIPYRYWDTLRWELRFYGNYTRPIPLFREFYQLDLARRYSADTTIKPLSFGIGYHYGPKSSSILVACLKRTKM